MGSLDARSVSGPRSSRSDLLGTFQLLGQSSRIAQVWRRFVQSVGDTFVLCAGPTRFGRRGKAAWCGQEDTGGARAAFRARGRQFAFRHRSQPCERPALLSHIFVRRHRLPASGPNLRRTGPSRIVRNYTIDSPAVNVKL